VLEGTLNLHTEHYEPVRLAPGDSILFDAVMPHAYVAEGDGDVVVLMSNTVPSDTGLPGAPRSRRAQIFPK
jgi:quercetin dioxygenase-like cupin family protein